MTRLSGITPSGHVQLGNYLGAIRRWPADAGADDLFFVSDLHALASPHNPAKLRVLKDFLAEHLAHIGELSEVELMKIRDALA